MKPPAGLFATFLLLIFLSYRASAHQDFVFSVNKGNIHLQYLSGWGQLEVGKKIDIFLALSDKLVRDKFSNSAQLFIDFRHDYTKRDTSWYTLGYGQFSFLDYGMNKTSTDITTRGIKIIIRDREFDIKKVLNLVNAAYANIDFIKNNQSPFITSSRNYNIDTLSSIQPALVKKYLSANDPVVEKLLGEKYYRSLKKVEDGIDIDYYYQNDQFHFYNTREPLKEWSESKDKYVVTKTFGEDILVVRNILEICGSSDDGHFVFTDDSTFYFIPRMKDTVRGPFTIDSVWPGRRPINKYYHEQQGVEKFYLFIDAYKGYNKVLFIPGSNILVSNYEKLEAGFIKGLSKKADDKKTAVKRSAPYRTTVAVLLVLLLVCVVLIIWLMGRQRNIDPIKQ